GGLLSISWGVRLAHALPERSLRMAFCAFLASCAVLLLVRG
ncbi:sulfite exporter TauE/SafE family protein, partial [Pseudomonas aeruginosa]|nr:sulfite exporter TauE/SafE family protein [Pseudomonas aeruginosa]